MINMKLFGDLLSKSEVSQVAVNPFVLNAPFLYPLKTSENRKGGENRCIGNEWANSEKSILAPINPIL